MLHQIREETAQRRLYREMLNVMRIYKNARLHDSVLMQCKNDKLFGIGKTARFYQCK